MGRRRTKPPRPDPDPFRLGDLLTVRAAGELSALRIEGQSEGFELVAQDGADGKPTLKRFSMTAYTGGAMQVGFGWPVVVDLAGMTVAGQAKPILKGHDPDLIVGHTDRIDVQARAIKVAGVISGVGDAAQEVTALAANGFPWQASIGASVEAREYVEAGQTVKVNGRSFNGPLIVARKTTLGEVSFVPIGADQNTSAAVAAQHNREDAVNFEKWLVARGFDPAKMTDAEKTLLRAAFDAEQKIVPPVTPPPTPAVVPPVQAQDDPAAGIRAKAAAEMTRIADVQAACDGFPPIAAKAVGEGWDLQTTKLAVSEAKLERLRAERPTVPGGLIHSPSEPGLSEAVLEAAVLQAGNCPLADDDFYFDREGANRTRRVPAKYQRQVQAEMKGRYTDQVQQAAHTLFKGRIGLQQVLVAGAAMNGHRLPEVIRDNGDVIKALRSNNWIQADGATVASIANVLANVQNKFLLQGYMFAEMVWRSICGVRSTKDFKPTKSISLFGDTEFDKLGPDGEIKGGAIQDQAFANQVGTRARMLAITREHIINDDLGALTTLPMILGRGANLKINKEFWTLWLDTTQKDEGGSTAFWAATHTLAGGQVGNANYISGASSALSSTSLQTANQTFDKQVDPMGNPLGMDLQILLYPPELDETAWSLLNSLLVVYAGSGSAAKQPGNNRWVGRFTPQKSRYLSNSAYTGYSTTAWWALSDPSVCPVIEMAFLNGQELPTIQTADADFDKLGIQMRGFFDIGVTMQNFRGGIKSAGA